ncbi:LOW QUALITY PROTEIN: hypothetical protein PHMEG_00031414 [Phytophthora megakarya]|uniref:Uncharacterized protein n=1 Tax=Phytophthora megakarya TaxID=4795 RepID=A0A225UYN6_9STRA|nr:LOW QUALITY PROTEIN: hypothetical protein PHMEG_00031414 [Phytophthora megakarya]
MRRRLPVKRTESQVARKTAVRKEESASSPSKRSQPKKTKEQSDPPPDDPDDSEPSDSDNDASRGENSDSSDAEGFSSEDEYIGMAPTTADGTTIWNCRPYIGYTNLEKFDEKASRDNRVNWKLYIGTTGSYSERYFTMKMTNQETPLHFFYRLNAAAVKAEVKFKSSSKLRESHIRRLEATK